MMRFSPARMDRLRQAALVHDVGKLAVPKKALKSLKKAIAKKKKSIAKVKVTAKAGGKSSNAQRTIVLKR